jgi:uncharacterized phage-associated protein
MAFAASLLAKWFVARAQRAGARDLDNLKLQKLLFLAQSRYSALAGRSLVSEPFEAWRHGPVVANVYHEYSEFKDSPIEQQLVSDGPWTKLEPGIEIVLDEVWTAFGVYSGWRLREITHDVGPWRDHYVPGVKRIVIPTSEIAASWSDFERLEADSGTSGAKLAQKLKRYKALSESVPREERRATPDELLADFEATRDLRGEADSHFR